MHIQALPPAWQHASAHLSPAPRPALLAQQPDDAVLPSAGGWLLGGEMTVVVSQRHEQLPLGTRVSKKNASLVYLVGGVEVTIF